MEASDSQEVEDDNWQHGSPPNSGNSIAENKKDEGPVRNDTAENRKDGGAVTNGIAENRKKDAL